MIRKYLEDWVYNSIKPIDISCECSMILGISDYKVNEFIIDMMPVTMMLSLFLYPIAFFMRNRKVSEDNLK